MFLYSFLNILTDIIKNVLLTNIYSAIINKLF